VNGSPEARRARVLRVVAAGRAIALRPDARAAMLGPSGLSPEGLALALDEHLETDPAPGDLDALLSAAGAAPRCHVVLAANVCTAALRALCVAVATAPAVFVRPSRRDPVLAALLVRELAVDAEFLAAGGAITLVQEAAPGPGDELHVYGTDEAVEALTAAAPPGVVVRAHGAGLGVAVVGRGAGLEDAAAALARSVVPFDQRGCLSPRFALVEGDAARAAAFAGALHDALAALGARVPRGPLDEATRGEIAMYRAALEAVGEMHEGPWHAVGLARAARALVLPPAARVVHVVPAEAGAAPALLGAWAGYVTSVGGEDGELSRAVLAMAPGARAAALGEMQRPPLDGPVDRRVTRKR
jgi:hypothetical protein